MSIVNWIICPVRNGLHLTKKALPTFLNQDIGDIGVILIDNASTDGTPEWARSLDCDLCYVHHMEPKSVAASWNKGLRAVFRESDHALVVNNDVELPPYFYRLLMEDSGPFVTGVGVSDHDCLNQAPNPSSKRPHPDFSAFMIRRECWNTVGPFDEDFEGAFFEDNAYHVRMHRAGIHAVAIDVPYYHVGSATIKNSTPNEQKRINSAFDRNKKLFFRKYGCYPGTPDYDALFTDPVAG